MISFAQIKTAHFWLTLAGTVDGMALAVLIFTRSPHLVTMGVMALVLVALNHAGVVNAAAWLPPGVRGKLDTADVKNMIASGIGALLERAGVKLDNLSSILAAEAQSALAPPPATAPTTVVVAENATVNP